MPRRPGFLSPPAVRRAMQKLDLDVKRLAVRTGVSAVTVRSWLGGRSAPSPKRLARLAEVLELDVREVTGVPTGLLTLTDLRVHAALTQAEAAERIRVSRTSLSDYELGASEPAVSLFPLFAEAYGVTTDLAIEAWQRSRDTLGGVR